MFERQSVRPMLFAAMSLLLMLSQARTAAPVLVPSSPLAVPATHEGWDPRFGRGLNGPVYAIAVNGADVYVGGSFTKATDDRGTVTVNGVAKWDGSRWSALGSGVSRCGPAPDTPCQTGVVVRALAVTGSTVYVGGDFTTVTDLDGAKTVNGVAKWDGSRWSSLGHGVYFTPNYFTVRALAIAGTDVYMGGEFTTVSDEDGETTVYNIARWDGSRWSALGGGVEPGSAGPVNAVAVSGTDVYVGGGFTTATDAEGTKTVNRIARWDGTRWNALGSGVQGGNVRVVLALAVRGSELYVGGDFWQAGEIQLVASNIARWNGSQWSDLGTDTPFGLFGTVFAIAISGTDIYVGGEDLNCCAVDGIARWDGRRWDRLGDVAPDRTVMALAASGRDVWVGSTKRANYLTKWDGSQWSSHDTGLDDLVLDLAWHDSDLYAVGYFHVATDQNGPKYSPFIARWDGTQWSALGGQTSGDVNTVAVMGDDVYVGGRFTTAYNADLSSVRVNNVARWDGNRWHPLGDGVNDQVYDIMVSGTDIYVAGSFTSATDAEGTKTVNHVARWSGSVWSALGGGVGGRVNVLAMDGTDVYVGGNFVTVLDTDGEKRVNSIARWNGRQWFGLGGGVSLPSSSPAEVNAIAVRDGDVYVGGWFTTATDSTGPKAMNSIARWDGVRWSGLGAGEATVGGVLGWVAAITVGGTGIYVGGHFQTVIDHEGTKTANHIAYWDGSRWSTLGAGLQSAPGSEPDVRALLLHGVDLYVGGWFIEAGEHGANYLALWRPALLARPHKLYLPHLRRNDQ